MENLKIWNIYIQNFTFLHFLSNQTEEEGSNIQINGRNE